MNKKVFKYAKIGGLVLLAVATVAGIFNLCVYNFVFRPNFSRAVKERTVEHEIEFYAGEENYRRHLEDSQFIESLNLPLIEITSFDSLKLKALVWDAENPDDCRGTVLLMHGFHSGPVREFATIARFLHSLNFNVVMPYQRSHGLSEGKFITFGVKERFDCRDWMLKINEIYGSGLPLFVGGISMGCATVTMAGGLELPSNVRGIISDCGFTEPYQIVRWTMLEQKHIWPGVADILLWSCDWYCKKIGGFGLKEYSTFDALSSCDLPFLFMTGTADETVPYEMTVQNFMLYKQRFPEKTKLVLFENVPHAVSYLLDSPRYEKELKKFLEKWGI